MPPDPPPPGWLPPIQCPECAHQSRANGIYCSTCRGPYYCYICNSVIVNPTPDPTPPTPPPPTDPLTPPPPPGTEPTPPHGMGLLGRMIDPTRMDE